MSVLIYIIAHVFVAYVLFAMATFIVEGVVWFPVLFLGTYVLVLFILSRAFWRPLHTTYPLVQISGGKRYLMVRAVSGPYKLVLSITVSKSGITLTAIPMFRLFHPPVHVPWSDMAISFPRSRVTKLTFTKTPFRDICLFRRIVTEQSMPGG